MATKLETAHEKYQGNVNSAMIQDLAAHLGVSADALQRLELGWAPIVKFKKGPNFYGWWTIPERDRTGNVVGLGLRSQSDMKVMLPGSKHGLIYEPNAEHERGSTPYKHGAHNWVRTMDAGLDCPVCGKPDGCLLSAEHPEDPQAVICRVKSSHKAMKFGYLHILKPEGNIKATAALLPASDRPILVVEGMTDTAAAMDLGFVAVGRPSNLAGLNTLKTLVRGRQVIVVGENDRKDDGSCPGAEGMLATFQILKAVCDDIRRVMPPAAVKDLRQWRTLHDLTAEEFLQYVEAEGDERVDTTVIPDDRDLTIAKVYLGDNFRMAGRYTLRCYNNVWFRYDGSKYTYVPDQQVFNPLYSWAHDKFIQVEQANGETSLQQIKANRHWVTNIVSAINAETEIIEPAAPCWINEATGPDPLNLIAFENGVMHVPTYLNGSEFAEYMLDPTPDLFTLASLPFSFDPTALCPAFMRWTRSSLGDEYAKIQLAQEFAGYAMTCDTSYHSLLWLRGVPSAGKSLFIDTLRNLVGVDQFAILKFRDLNDKFGLTKLVGTLIAAMPDLRMPKHGDPMMALEMILNLTGEDAIPIERKFKDAEKSHKLHTRIVISSNEMPQFHDPTGALKRRLLLLEFKRGFVGREDRSLSRQFKAETPGIAVWALEGLRRLHEAKAFTVPDSMRDVLDDWHRDNSPVSTFIEECILYDADTHLTKRDAYRAFRGWCTEHDHFPCNLMNFKQRWTDRIPSDVRSKTVTDRGHKYSVYTGVKLVDWAKKAYLGHPTHS